MLRRIALLGSAGLTVALLAGCPPPAANNNNTPVNGPVNGPGGGGGGGVTGTLTIGHYASLTGNTAMFGQTTDNGVKLAADEVSRAGKLRLDINTLDDASQQQQVPLVVNRLISQYRATAIVGEVASSRSIAAGPIADAQRVPMV